MAIICIVGFVLFVIILAAIQNAWLRYCENKTTNFMKNKWIAARNNCADRTCAAKACGYKVCPHSNRDECPHVAEAYIASGLDNFNTFNYKKF